MNWLAVTKLLYILLMEKGLEVMVKNGILGEVREHRVHEFMNEMGVNGVDNRCELPISCILNPMKPMTGSLYGKL